MPLLSCCWRAIAWLPPGTMLPKSFCTAAAGRTSGKIGVLAFGHGSGRKVAAPPSGYRRAALTEAPYAPRSIAPDHPPRQFRHSASKRAVLVGSAAVDESDLSSAVQ